MGVPSAAQVAIALGRLGEVSPGVEAALLTACGDPYFEVRAEAARTAARLADRLIDCDAMVAALIDRLSDRWLEVASAAAHALGRVGHAHDALPALLALQDARLWRLRAAASRCSRACRSRRSRWRPRPPAATSAGWRPGRPLGPRQRIFHGIGPRKAHRVL